MIERNVSVRLSEFRGAMHVAFCGKKNETSKCPEGCPVRQLSPYNWGRIRIKDMLVMKEGRG